MRIYAVADIHGKPDYLERIEQKTAALRPHVLVVAGDITNFASPARVLSRINALAVPVLAIRGNTDFKKVERLIGTFRHIRSIHLSRHLVHAIPFVGIGGTIPIPFHSKIRLNETFVLNRAAALLDKESILVVHPPPRGVLDTAFGRFHVGSSGLRRFVERYQPRVVICGHVHECAGSAALAGTMVVNCSMGPGHSGALIEYSPGGELKISMI